MYRCSRVSTLTHNTQYLLHNVCHDGILQCYLNILRRLPVPIVMLAMQLKARVVAVSANTPIAVVAAQLTVMVCLQHAAVAWLMLLLLQTQTHTGQLVVQLCVSQILRRLAVQSCSVCYIGCTALSSKFMSAVSDVRCCF
jgi:hypothetical protein